MDDKILYQENRKSHKRFRPSKPFWNDELKLEFGKITKIERDLKNCTYRRQRGVLRRTFKEQRKAFDQLYRRAERVYHKEKLDKLEQDCGTDPKSFWTDVKKLGPRNKREIPWQVENEIGEITGDRAEVLERWVKDFEALYNPTRIGCKTRAEAVHERDTQDFTYLSELNMSDPLYEPVAGLNNNFTIEEIKKALDKLKNKKATGVDNVPNEILKLPVILDTLKELLQLYFDTGIIPSSWEKAIIKPLPKSSDKDQKVPLNYRGISLLSCVGKLYTSILNNRMLMYLDSNTLLNEEQNGFRKGRSCSEHIFTLHSIVQGRLEQKKKTWATFVDFSKAFDGVSRSFLLYKLLQVGVDGKFYKAVKSIYRHTVASINLNGELSKEFETFFGVRQGDSMSPTLFAIFINDLATELKLSNLGVRIGDQPVPILMYADDIILLADDQETLQSMLDILYAWCQKWAMTVNFEKTKFIEFRGLRQNSTDVKFYFGDTEIMRCSSYKYLGVYFDEKLKFDVHDDMISKAAKKALGALQFKYRQMKNMGYKTFTRLFETERCSDLRLWF